MNSPGATRLGPTTPSASLGFAYSPQDFFPFPPVPPAHAPDAQASLINAVAEEQEHPPTTTSQSSTTITSHDTARPTARDSLIQNSTIPMRKRPASSTTGPDGSVLYYQRTPERDDAEIEDRIRQVAAETTGDTPPPDQYSQPPRQVLSAEVSQALTSAISQSSIGVDQDIRNAPPSMDEAPRNITDFTRLGPADDGGSASSRSGADPSDTGAPSDNAGSSAKEDHRSSNHEPSLKPGSSGGQYSNSDDSQSKQSSTSELIPAIPVTVRFKYAQDENGNHLIIGREGVLAKCEDEVGPCLTPVSNNHP